MSTFEERENSFESRYAHEEELLFKARSRRNLMIGRWVAHLLGLNEVNAENYADEVVASEVGQNDDVALTQRLSQDLAGANVDMSARRVARKLEELQALALRDIKEGR